jgi:carbamoyl-phosphate synthase large subunit
VVNTPQGKNAYADETNIRRQSLRLKIPCITNMSAALAACEAVDSIRGETRVRTLQDLAAH